MPRFAKHLVLLGIALPSAVLGYHAVSVHTGVEGEAVATTDLVNAVEGFAAARAAGPSKHRLGSLDLLSRDFYLVGDRYVEPARIDPDAMFEGALAGVERQFAPVLFVKEPQGRRLRVTVGAHTTTLLLDPMEDLDDVVSQLTAVAQVLDAHLPSEIDRAEVEYQMVNGGLRVLDPHTVLMPPAQARDMDVDNEGEFGGLGIEISLREGRLIVTNVLDDTPAARAGLQANDHIARIEDLSTLNMDMTEAVGLLRGKVGTRVEIRVDREGFDDPKPFMVTRAKIPIGRVQSELLEGDVGYVRIQSFNALVKSDLDDALTRFKREVAGNELQGLIIDLRGNPGGYLHAAVDTSDLFLADGEIVTTVESGGKSRDSEVARSQGTEPDYPIAVLVNGNSASASEIVAGALRNRKRAVIIGERTFGKGSVQHLFRHSDDSKLKLTVAQYLTPGDKSIQSVGIPPDILLRPTVIDMPEEDEERSLVSFYWRDRVDREADLDKHLEWRTADLEKPVYEVRYLLDTEADVETHQDWEASFARELLLAARGVRRAEVLQSAGEVVSRRQEQEVARIEGALVGLEIDWREGSNVDPELAVSIDLGGDEVLSAGEVETLTVRVTNEGTSPLHRLSAVLETDHPVLDGQELTLGYLAPGETIERVEEVRIPRGFGDGMNELDVVFRDPQSPELARESLLVRTSGVPLPRLAYSVTLDDTEGGDGDGLPEVGETVRMLVDVENIGEGRSGQAYVRLKNRSGKALDLIEANETLGLPVDPEAEGCGTELESSCDLAIAPGETARAELVFELRDAPSADAFEVELFVGDSGAYDYATISEGGFSGYFQQSESLSFEADAAFGVVERKPPGISLSRAPEVLTDLDQVVLSGVVEDDQGVEELMIFQGEDKIFFLGGGAADQSVPFTVDVALDPGANRITVLARNSDGLTSSRTLRAWRAEQVAQAADVRGDKKEEAAVE